MSTFASCPATRIRRRANDARRHLGDPLKRICDANPGFDLHGGRNRVKEVMSGICFGDLNRCRRKHAITCKLMGMTLLGMQATLLF